MELFIDSNGQWAEVHFIWVTCQSWGRTKSWKISKCILWIKGVKNDTLGLFRINTKWVLEAEQLHTKPTNRRDWVQTVSNLPCATVWWREWREKVKVYTTCLINQHGGGQVYDLYHSQPPGGDHDSLASHLAHSHVHLYIQFMVLGNPAPPTKLNQPFLTLLIMCYLSLNTRGTTNK